MSRTEETEFEMLMSLALDDRLSPAEAQRFQALLARSETGEDSQCIAADVRRHEAAEWELWQEVDTWLDTTHHVAPPLGFSARVMQQIALQERRTHLWLGAGIGLAAILLWGTGVLAAIGLVALFSVSEALWLGEIAQSPANWWTALSGFVVSALRSASAILSTAQARAAVMVYCTLATGMLGLWWLWLRNTTELEQREEELPA